MRPTLLEFIINYPYMYKLADFGGQINNNGDVTSLMIKAFSNAGYVFKLLEYHRGYN